MKQKKILITYFALLLVFWVFTASPALSRRHHHTTHRTHKTLHTRSGHKKTSRPRTAKFNGISVDGIDVSHHNTINWATLAKNYNNIHFAYIKAVEGRTHKDQKFKNNVRAARKHGLKVGAYLLYSSNSTPRQQFNAFLSVVRGTACNLIPAIDIEKARICNSKHEKVAKDIVELSRLLQKHYGKRPLIYCHDEVYIKYLRKRLPHNHLWICNYRFRPKLKDHNGYVWQFSNRARLSGVSGHVDVDHLCGAMTLGMLKL